MFICVYFEVRCDTVGDSSYEFPILAIEGSLLHVMSTLSIGSKWLHTGIRVALLAEHKCSAVISSILEKLSLRLLTPEFLTRVAYCKRNVIELTFRVDTIDIILVCQAYMARYLVPGTIYIDACVSHLISETDQIDHDIDHLDHKLPF